VRTFDLRSGCLFRDHIDGKLFQFILFKFLIQSNIRHIIIEPVVSLALSSDQRSILASSLDKSLRLIQKETGKELKR
jgi:tricorn protease-like protein